MTIEYVKNAARTPTTGEAGVREAVAEMLSIIRTGGEEKVLHFARELDNWSGDVIVSEEEIEAAKVSLSPRLKSDIDAAHDQVKRFASAQLESMHEFEIELNHGLVAGQRLIPVNTAGCYVPGGRYAHIASAIMSITTAKVAGVPNVIACSPPGTRTRMHPAIIYTADLCGADSLLNLGGVQGIAAMAFGLFTGNRADMLVGPGNRYVAEAKRLLFGEVGIDVFAGPTEVAIIADETADPWLVACDLVSQVEHGPDSPAWLISQSWGLVAHVQNAMEECFDRLPEPNRSVARAAWRDYGEIVVAQTREEAVSISDSYAPEHLEVHAADLSWWLQSLTNYGSLFLGEETTVAHGDKSSGPNHILPTRGAARYTGGLSVGKFLKSVTYQRMTPEGSRGIGALSSRISRLEGMEGHATASDARLRKYFPKEVFDVQP